MHWAGVGLNVTRGLVACKFIKWERGCWAVSLTLKSSDTRGTAARCKIPALSSRGEAVEASDGGQVLMNSRRCLWRSTRESSEMHGAVGKNDENCNIHTAGSTEATGMGLRDLRDK